MRVDQGQPQVAGKLAGASTSTPATTADSATTNGERGPAGESTGPATWLSSPADTQPGDTTPLHEAQVAGPVEVWSHTSQLWLPALVERVLDDSWFEVSFHGGARLKELPRSQPELRPFRPMPGKG